MTLYLIVCRTFSYRRGFLGGVIFCCFLDLFFCFLGFKGDGSRFHRGSVASFLFFLFGIRQGNWLMGFLQTVRVNWFRSRRCFFVFGLGFVYGFFSK